MHPIIERARSDARLFLTKIESKELDLNPIFACSGSTVAVNARVILANSP